MNSIQSDTDKAVKSVNKEAKTLSETLDHLTKNYNKFKEAALKDTSNFKSNFEEVKNYFVPLYKYVRTRKYVYVHKYNTY